MQPRVWTGRKRSKEGEDGRVQLQQVQQLRHPRPRESVQVGEARLVYTPGVELPPELLGQGERPLDRGRFPRRFPRFQPLLGIVEIDDDVGDNSPATGAIGEPSLLIDIANLAQLAPSREARSRANRQTL